jgi:hypothetical protein
VVEYSQHGRRKLTVVNYKPSPQPTSWQTSSLYTFSPVSGLVTEHLVETIRPLPGESVGAWLSARLWHGRAAESEGYQTIPGVGMVGAGMGMNGETMVKVVDMVEDPVGGSPLTSPASSKTSSIRDRDSRTNKDR